MPPRGKPLYVCVPPQPRLEATRGTSSILAWYQSPDEEALPLHHIRELGLYPEYYGSLKGHV